MTETADCLVVGAGPAGSAAAITLAGRGLSVMLLEREDRAGRPVCGGFLGPETLTVIRQMGLEAEFHELPKRPIASVLISSPSIRLLEQPLPSGGGWAVDRSLFNQWLAGAAERRGVRISYRAAPVAECRSNGAWQTSVDMPEGRLEIVSRELIRAHGRRAPKNVPADRSYFACKTVYEGVEGLDGRVALHFVTRGHVGLNPMLDGRTTMCLYIDGGRIRAHRGDLDAMMRSFLSENQHLSRQLSGARRVTEWRSCQAEPDGRRLFADRGAFMAGDAVSMADPIIGGGIPIAMRSAVMLANLIADARRTGEVAETTAERYKNEWMREFARRLSFSRQLGAVERSPWMSALVFKGVEFAPFFYKYLIGRSRHGAGLPA